MGIKGGIVDASGEKLVSVRLVTDTDANSGIGSAQDPIRTDPTGTTVQPVSFSSPQHVIVDSGGGGGGAVTVADGADVAQGATTDAAITSNTTGTISGKLRGLVAILADIWDSVNHRIKVDGSGVTQPVSVAATLTTAPAGSRYQTLETSTPLGGNATFTGPWHDTTVKGENYVALTAISNLSFAATNGVQIQESEDQSNVSAPAFSGANTTIRLCAMIRARYWRVVITNGSASAQGSLSVYTTASLVPLSSATSAARFLNNTEQLPINTAGSLAAMTDNMSANILRFADGTGTNFAPVGVCEAKVSSTGGTFLYARPRMPGVFVSVSTAATGNTAVWTPTAGKKFRLQRFRLQISGNATQSAAGVLTVQFQDASVNIPGTLHNFFVNTTAANVLGGFSTPWIDLGEFGILSAAANNVLNVNLSAALTAGTITVIACGCEE